MRTTLPVLLSFALLTACGDENKDADASIDPTDDDITDTDEEGGDTQADDEPEGPTSLAITPGSYAEADLFAGDNKLQVLMGTDPIQLSHSADPSDTDVTWSSSKARVVSVSDSGELTFNGDGTAEITVSAGQQSASVLVEVADSFTRSQYGLQIQRHEPPVGDGGEGGSSGLVSNFAFLRTGAFLENAQATTEADEVPRPIRLRLHKCSGAIEGGSNSPYIASWRPTSLNIGGFTSFINYCNIEPAVEGPYLLTKPVSIVPAQDVSPHAGGEGDTAGWPTQDTLCALTLEGHNSMVWKGHTLPDNMTNALRFSARVAGNLAGSGAVELSVVDTETGDIVSSTSNLIFSSNRNFWSQLFFDITVPENMGGKTVDLIFDFTGYPQDSTPYGEDNLWLDDLELSAYTNTAGGPQTVSLPLGASANPTSSGKNIPIPVDSTLQLVATDSCDSLDSVKPLRMFEGRTYVFSTSIPGLGTAKRRVFVPHDEEEMFIRNIDTFTNGSGQAGLVSFQYNANFAYGGQNESFNGTVANGRGHLSLPSDPRTQYAAAVVAGDENSLYGNWGTATGSSAITLDSGETVALMSFVPLAKYEGQFNGDPNETYLTPIIEDIVTSFASDPLESDYALGITADIWNIMLGWSNPDPLTPVPGDSVPPDSGGF